jgi:hypothetical protein
MPVRKMLVLLAVLCLSGSACVTSERSAGLTIVNYAKYNLTVTVNGQFVAKIANFTELKTTYVIGTTRYLIEAKYDSGMVVYSREYSGDQLRDMGAEIHILTPPGIG